MAFRDGLQMGILKEEEGLLMGEWGVEAQRDKVLTWMETREVN